MKRIILLTLLISLVIGLYAQQQLRPKASSLQVDEVYYLYNVQKDGFLVGGNKWNTQASIAHDHANKVIVRKAIKEGQLWDGETYYITDSVETGDFSGNWRRIFIEVDTNVFIDQQVDGEFGGDGTSTDIRDNLWVIKPLPTSKTTYTISPSPANITFNSPMLLLSVEIDTQGKIPVIGIFEKTQNRNSDWYFVKPEDAHAYLQAKKEERERLKRHILDRIVQQFSNNTIPTEQVVYMYNPLLDGFLVGEHLYKTQASISQRHAYKVILHKYIDAEGNWDGNSYLISDSVEMGNYANKYRNLFIGKDGYIWVDQRGMTSHLDHIWSIMPSKRVNGAFQVRPSNNNHAFRYEKLPDYLLGCEDGQEIDVPILSLTNKDENTDWMFLLPQQYKKILQGHYRQELQGLILEVKDAFPNIDTTSFQKICDNENSSNTDINDVIGTLRLYLNSEGRKEETSFTDLLENPDFINTGGKGWSTAYNVEVGTLTWWGGKTDTNPCAEAYQAVYDFWQEVKGIPNGLYRLDVQAFARTRGVDLAFIERDSSFIVPVIYANDMEMPIRDLMQTTYSDTASYTFLQRKSEDPTAVMLLVDGTYVPNNQWTASSAFEEGLYDQSVYCRVTDGSIRIGIRETNKRTGSWTAWDNFRLTYLPETPENYQKAVNTYKEKAKEIEQLAKIKHVDVTMLSNAVEEADIVISDSNIEELNKYLTLLNQQIVNVREKIRQKEFAADVTTPVYLGTLQVDQDVEDTDDERADSTTILLDRAEALYRVAQLGYDAKQMDKTITCLTNSIEYMLKPETKLRRRLVGYSVEGVGIVWSESYEPSWFVDAVDMLRYCLFQKERYQEAVDLLQKVEDKCLKYGNDPDEEFVNLVYQAAGELLDQYLHQPKEAEEKYRKGLEVYKRRNVTQEMANKYNGDIEETRNKFYGSKMAIFLNGIAYAQAHQQHYDEALESIEQAIELQPEEAYYYDSKGEILYMKGDKQGARNMWEKVISINSNFVEEYDSELYKLLYKQKSK